MKILLLNPCYKVAISDRYEKYFVRSGSRWPHSGVKRKGTIPHYLPFPFYLAYSATVLKNAGYEVYALDAVAGDSSEEVILDKISALKPRLVFYEVTTPTIGYDLILAQKIKAVSSSVIAIGGTGATTFASQILENHRAIDFVLKGEYEFLLLELIKCLEEGKGDFPSGVVFRKKGEIIDKGYPTLIEPLDKLPFPERDIFPSNENPNIYIYWDGFCQFYPAIQMHTSRGCPYRCYFCLWNQIIYNNGKYRTFSPQRVVDEMQEIKYKYKAKEIYIDDDDFIISKAHVTSICDEIIKRNLEIKWSCMADAINLDKEMIARMAHSGCIGIKFGVESGSQKILNTLGKPVNLIKVKEIVKWCRLYKIKTHATFMLGLLGESKDDLKKTIKFAQDLDVDSIQVSIATPFPGTWFYSMVEAEGLLRSKDWKFYDGKTSEIVSHPYLDYKEVERLRKKLFLGWFLKRWFLPFKAFRKIYIFIRVVKSLGICFFFKNLSSVIVDEVKNK